MKKNNFQHIEPKENLPESHKSGVIDSIELAKLFLDMADLFSSKRVRTEAEILKSVEDRKKNNVKDK